MLLPYMVAVVTVLWRFVSMVHRHSYPELVVTRDFLGDVSSVAPVSSNLSSVSIVHFLSGFLSSSGSVLGVLTSLCIQGAVSKFPDW